MILFRLYKSSCFTLFYRMANFEALSIQGSGVNESKKKSGLNEYAASLFDDTLTWKDVAWLKTVTSLPVVIKGILTGKYEQIFEI